MRAGIRPGVVSAVLLEDRSVTMLMTVAMPHETHDVEDAPKLDRR